MSEKIYWTAAKMTRRVVCHSLLISLLLGMLSPSLAADGWYLLVPPKSKYNKNAEYLSGYKISATTPLSQWGQQGAYDSASECEAIKQNLIIIEQNTYAKSDEDYIKAVGAGGSQTVLDFQRAIVEALNANVWAFMGSRCIKSNDPRLKP